MKERKKPTQSWIGRSIEEIEKEAFEKGWEAGFADACEITHKFAEMVYKMRKAQEEERITRGWITESSEGMTRHLRHLERRQDLEAEVETWIQENYPHLMEG